MKITVILITLIFSTTLFSQNYDFGKVSKEELQETIYPGDSSASAAYLYKNRKTFFKYTQGQGFSLITEVHERIKIYNPEGFKYATKTVHLYKSGSTDEELHGLKAYTYNLVGGKVEEVKLKKDGVFKTELSKYYNEEKFTMPNIKDGTVVEYKYEIESPFYSMVDEFQFQHDIPIKKLEASFEAPEYFNFKLNTKGFLQVVPVIENKNGRITFNHKARSSTTGYSGADATQTSYSSEDINFSKAIWTYNLKDVPALKDEPYVNNINNYRSSVKFELSYRKYPNEPAEYFSTTWGDVVKTIYKSENFGEELKKSGYFEKDIDALIEGVSDPIKKMRLIFDFVKKTVKWNKYYGAYASNGLKKAYKEHTGNVADINLMLTTMLRYAGLDANPVLVSTRSNGIPIFPTTEGFNYVIAGVELENNIVLLDATVKNSMPNILPFRALNWNGRLVRESGTSATVSLYPKEKSKTNIIFMSTLTEDGTLEGSMRTLKTDHKAMSYRSDFNGKDEDKFIENLENEYDGIEIDAFNVKNNDDLSKPIIETIHFTIDDQADIINDKIYFSPLFFLGSKESPFKLENREFPVDFGYPSSSSYRFIINLPEGYKIESMPEPRVYKLPEDLGMFVYQIAANGNEIQVTVNSDINSAIVSSLHYDALKAYFTALIEKENEQIVLTRI